MADLFDPPGNSFRPLADRLRPRSLDEVEGQDHLLGKDKPLRRILDQGQIHSMVLWGPPGSGKTTLALLIAHHTDSELLKISAVMGGVAEIRKAVARARELQAAGRRSLLFVDEVHRFNKAQQDAFLPHVEDGTVTFVGATTENPSFELNNALLSRSRVYILKPVNREAVVRVLRRALSDKLRGLGSENLSCSDETLYLLSDLADGDARRALNYLEMAADLVDSEEVSSSVVRQVAGERVHRFDKGGDAFYEQISALHKSVRNSNPDAALYWYMRMLDGGCGPEYVARRLVRMASEDLGNADPRALQVTLDAWQAYERLGSPEGDLAIAQAVIYLACAPKSNAVYKAFKAAEGLVGSSGSLPVPLAMRNAPTKLMKELGYGDAYLYDPDEPGGFAASQRCFPEDIGEPELYTPVDQGLEIQIGSRLQKFRELRREALKKKPAKRKKRV